MTESAFKAALHAAQQRAEAQIAQALLGQNNKIADAMRYATAGGKGLRAFLVQESAALHGISADAAAPAMGAIEALHAYSLIHDDLPCMDDDDLRRGQPTVHRKWDQATAVLAGDALHTLAFEMLGAAPNSQLDLMVSLAQAAGVCGMVGGQSLDIEAEKSGSPLTLEQITTLQQGKTGALIKWAACVGPRMAEADIGPLAAYADALGLAFQIVDDILDVEGDAATVGKAVGKDAGRGKATFVSLLGLDGAKRRARDLVQSAEDVLECYGENAQSLVDAARFVIARES